jgi:hypothetical protein
LLVLALLLLGATGSNLSAAETASLQIFDYDHASTPTTGASTTHSGPFRGYDGRSHTSGRACALAARLAANAAKATPTSSFEALTQAASASYTGQEISVAGRAL